MSVNIHFKSDFKLFESPAKDASFTFLVPFRFAYYTVGNVEYVVSHSNGEYTNCELLEDGRLKVIFENHGLAPGRIMCRREFFLTDEDYADNICDVRLTTATDVFLTMQGRDVGDITVKVPMYYQKGDKGDPFTWEDMTPEQRAYFIDQVGADVVATNEAVIAAEAARQQYYEQWKPEAERVTNDARTQGMYAMTEGIYARNRGDEAKAYGDYAKEQGDSASSGGAFAKIQAEYAIEQAGEARKAALIANEAGAAANIAAAEATTAAQKATDKGDYAKGQGDYAKEQGDKALEATSEAYEALDQVREVITKSNRATANADEATAEAIEAINRVNGAIGNAESAASSADYAREQLEALEIEFNNAEAARETAEAQRQTDTAKAISDVKSETTAALSGMQSKVNTAVGNANQAAENTNQAIEKANIATNNANTAATNANTAANEAEEAAASANAAKESIQEELGAKADKTGEYKELTAGFAYEILGDGQATSEKFLFRPTGGPNRNVRDGSARIEVLKGNSVVWNQLLGKFNDITIEAYEKFSIKLFISSSTDIIRCQGTLTEVSGDNNVYLDNLQTPPYAIKGHKYVYLVNGCNLLRVLAYNFCAQTYMRNEGAIVTATSDARIRFCVEIPYDTSIGSNIDENIRIKIVDLTKMFGAGNEPATVKQFYEMLPEGVDIYAFNEGKIVDANYGTIKTTGFNQWDEQWAEGQIASSNGNVVAGGNKIISKNFIPAIPNTSYFITLPLPQDDSHGVYYYDINKQFIKYQWMPSGSNKNQFTTPSNCAFIKFDSGGTTYNNDICVNIAWDEYSALNGQYKPYKPFERDLSWANKYFPATINGETKYGMRSAGNVADEIRFNSTTQQWEAVQRVGVRAYQSGDDADTAVTTDGKNTNYALATPIATPVTEDVNLAYDVADYGTEQLIVADGAQSAPLSAEVVYEPNVLASIKQVAAMLTRLDALETAVATMQASAVATTNEE